LSLDRRCLKELLGLGSRYTLLSPSTRTYLTNGFKLQGECQQFTEKFAYGYGSLGLNFHEVRIRPFLSASHLNFVCFQIRILLRLTLQRGGDGTTHGISVMNDTGSSILSLFDTDMQHLGSFQGYTGRLGQVEVRSANGMIDRYPRIHVQVQLMRDDDSPWSGWIDEWALVKPSSPNVPRLSGIGMRDILYLGTAPGNNLLAVAATKGGLTSLL
jgi:hypothetical protein